MKQSCKTCIHFDIEGAKGPGGRVRSNSAVRCYVPAPVIIVPDSWRSVVGNLNPNHTPYTCANYGATCPTYKQRKP